MRRGWGVWLCAMLLLAAPCAWASEEAAGHGQGSLDFIGKVVNFLVLFGGLAFVLVRPLREFLRSRTETARRDLEESAAERREAEDMLAAARGRLAGLSAEASALRKSAEDEGRLEQEKIRRLAREEMDKIRKLTQLEMDAQVKAGIGELRRHAAELAARRALDRIKAGLNPERQAALIGRSIELLAERNEKEGAGPPLRPGTR